MDTELPKVDMDKLRKIEIDMLSAVDSIAKQLGINYFLLGGSLLGAVRHKGFIPWDDDIDIGMLRHDYNRFIAEAQRLLPSYYFLQNYHTDRDFPLLFSKIRDSRTTFIEKSSKHLKINHGVFIDIFPIDFVNDYESWFTRKKRALLVSRISDKLKIKRSIKSKIKILLCKILWPSYDKAVKILDTINSNCNNGAFRTNYYGAWGEKETVDATLFDGILLLDFEGLRIPGLKAYDKYLKHIYGDYMQLPPVDKRISHHYTEIIDLDRPYTKYFDY